MDGGLYPSVLFGKSSHITDVSGSDGSLRIQVVRISEWLWDTKHLKNLDLSILRSIDDSLDDSLNSKCKVKSQYSLITTYLYILLPVRGNKRSSLGGCLAWFIN